MSAAEQAGVEKLAGVLPTEKLDASLRAVAAYGLNGYTLASTSYTLETDYTATPIAKDADGEEERTPVCRLRYVLAAEKSDKVEPSEDAVKSRTFTVDARTGEVRQMYSSTPWGRDAVLTEAQAREKAEAFVCGMNVSPYEKGNIFNKDPLRVRKLLLHKVEIRKLAGKTAQQGYTIVPLQVYFKDGRAKIEIGLAKGKKLYDKRRDIARKDLRREHEREFKIKNLG